MPSFNTFVVVFGVIFGVIFWLWEKDPETPPEIQKALKSASELESLKLREEVFGMEHPENHIMRVNYSLSLFLEKMGRRAYLFFRTRYAERHPDLLWYGTNLHAILRDYQGNE